MSSLENLLSEEELYQLKLAGLIGEIESGEFMVDYLSWLNDKKPEIITVWKHVKYIASFLDKIANGELKRLMISLHPRVGKSTIVTQSFPIYMMSKNPNTNVILAAHTQTLANKFSLACRSFAERSGLKLNKDRRARDEWQLQDYEGGMRAVGAGVGISGIGGALIILDDPIRSMKDANSVAVRDHLYDWYQADVFTRMEKGAAIIYIATRWNSDDLAGRILENEGELSENNPNGWAVINLPAIATEHDILGRRPGDALCPDRFSLEQLLQIKKVLGNEKFQALYQGMPVSESGGMFKKEWFRYVEYIPREEYGELDYVRYWDLASSEEVTSDYTAGALLARSRKSKNIYVLDMQRFRLSTYERDQKILQTAKKDKQDYSNVKIYIEQQPGSAGKDVALAMSKLLQGFVVKNIPSRGNKVSRADPFASQCEGGTVYIKKADWNREFLSEISMFDKGTHDDQVDAVGGAFNQLSSSGGFIRIGKGI